MNEVNEINEQDSSNLLKGGDEVVLLLFWSCVVCVVRVVQRKKRGEMAPSGQEGVVYMFMG